MSYQYGEKTIYEGRSWVDNNGVTHPTNWGSWSAEEKTAVGLVKLPDPEGYDSRFFWAAGIPREVEDIAEVDGNGEPILDTDGVQIVTPGLKSTLLKKTNKQMVALLQSSDGYYTREVDNGAVVPVAVQAYRQEVRVKAGIIEQAIMSCADISEIIALHEGVVDEAEAVIANAVINDWPLEKDVDVAAFVPDKVTVRQARLALLDAGLLDVIEATITDPAAIIAWRYSSIIARNSPLVSGFAAGLSLTDTQVDDLFRAALQY